MENYSYKDNRWLMVLGRYLLATFFLLQCISYLIRPWEYIMSVPLWLGDPFFWVMVASLFWFSAATSFYLNVWARALGLLITLVILIIVGFIIWSGINYEGSYIKMSLKVAFYVAFAGGALMVAARSSYISDWKINDKFSDIIFIIGRIFVGLFFIVVGMLHFINLEGDTKMISWMPGAQFWVIFIGIAWLATSLSLIFNVLSRLSSLLAGFVILAITFTVNIQAYTSADYFSATLGVMQNLAIVGVLLIIASNGTMMPFPLKKKSVGWN